MNYLLDTHIIIWLLEGNPRLPKDVLEILTSESNNVYYSTVSIWEVTIKKMSHPSEINIVGSKLSELCKESGMKMIPIIDKHVCVLETINHNTHFPEHKDPFDRMLISQAKAENMILITHDSKMSEYDEECIMKI